MSVAVCLIQCNVLQIVRIAVHVCMAMHHLHGIHNIEHRDIKLSNIMLSLTRSGTIMGREFVAKLCDFGCAASLQVNRSDVGTVAYRPPESFDRSEVLHNERAQCSSGDEVDEKNSTAEQPEDPSTQVRCLPIFMLLQNGNVCLRTSSPI